MKNKNPTNVLSSKRNPKNPRCETARKWGQKRKALKKERDPSQFSFNSLTPLKLGGKLDPSKTHWHNKPSKRVCSTRYQRMKAKKQTKTTNCSKKKGVLQTKTGIARTGRVTGSNRKT